MLKYINQYNFQIFLTFPTKVNRTFGYNMLSILIPTYNYDCTALVAELQQQITASQITAEVIVLDDASPNTELRNINKSINRLPHCRWVVNEQNMGRARTINRLASLAQYEFLLILDSDVFPVYHDFITRYCNYLHSCDAAIGGLAMRPQPPLPERMLRYKYGCKVEVRSVEQRAKKPFADVHTSNILIRRDKFLSIRFNEKFTQYGHEDTLLGREMQRNNYSLLHIDNPVFHDGIESNEVFLNKTRIGIENIRLHSSLLHDNVKLLQFYNKLRKCHIDNLIAHIFYFIEKPILLNLNSRNPSLTLFNLYKVGYLCKIMREKKI